MSVEEFISQNAFSLGAAAAAFIGQWFVVRQKVGAVEIRMDKIELTANNHITREELNAVVVERMNRVEAKLDRLIESR